MKFINEILLGDALERLHDLPDETVDMCLTSPPYFGLRDYGIAGQIGQEDSPEAYVEKLLLVFAEVNRVLKPEGTLWLNIADSYAGSCQGAGTKHPARKQHSNRGTQYMFETGFKSKLLRVKGCKSKDMIGIPWLLAFALRDAGWYLRQDICWYKPNTMPESVKDRCTKSYEHVFLLAKCPKYYFNGHAIREPCTEASIIDYNRRKTLDNKGGGKTGDKTGKKSYEGVRPDLCRSRADYFPKDHMRRPRDVWMINTKPYRGAHFATFPEELAQRCILAGCPEGGLVLDPFMGSGTTAVAAQRLNRQYVGIELNPEYIILAQERVMRESTGRRKSAGQQNE